MTSNTKSNEISKVSSTSSVKIPVKKDGEFELVPIEQERAQLPIAHATEAMKGLGRYILATRKDGSWNTNLEPRLLKDLLDENDVTIQEAYLAFRKAYSDQYTPASGVEWRHLWKYIEEIRLGRDRRLYSYDEMLAICDRENINTDHFEPVRDEGEVIGWRRK